MSATLRGLEGKVVYITGAGRGQGANHARAFAEAGCNVIATDICEPIPGLYPTATQELLDLTVKQVEQRGARALGLKVDVRDEDQVKASVEQAHEEFGQIDILVNNAGMSNTGMLHEMSRHDWDVVVDIVLTGQAMTCKHVVPNMISRRTGKIVNIASAVVGSGMTMLSNYVAAKHGVVGLTKALATELGEFDINVNAIAPGTIRPTDEHGSGMVRGVATDYGATSAEELYEQVSAQFNMAGDHWRIEMQDITDAVLFLASDNARMITGVLLPVDAGQTTR
jgi:NAD(P)-dependent dehydrogenase (short-subunit alcohol dehydrogenase family)